MPKGHLPLQSCWHIVIAAVLLPCLAAPAAANLYINEIFLDPGGDGDDNRDEYIELRGTPGMSLDNHYLVLIENEGGIGFTGDIGVVENIFILGDNPNTSTVEEPYRIGDNGFMTIRQKGSLYTNIAPGTFDILNTGEGVGYGNGATSSIRHSSNNSGDGGGGRTENSGFTAMLIRNDGDPVFNQPFLNQDLDIGNNGLDDATNDQFDWSENWEIIDAIGVFSSPGEAGWGRLYAPVNFGPEVPGQELSPSQGGVPDGNGGFVFQPHIEDGAVYVGLGYEIELLARWGDSTGQTPDDWHATNVSDRTVEGRFTASAGVDAEATTPVIDYRQSGGFHEPLETDVVETNQYVPYGTPLTTTLGSSNYPLNAGLLPGDFSGDGYIDAADYTVWRDSLGQSGLGLLADADGSGSVDSIDFDWWVAKYGSAPGKSSGVFYSNPLASSFATPEPTTAVLVILTGTMAIALRRR